MQDRYAGDLGDYLTFGLLRWLVPVDSTGPLRLGVVWYRTVDETHNADGKHIAYLQLGHRSSAGLRRSVGRADRTGGTARPSPRLAGAGAGGDDGL